MKDKFKINFFNIDNYKNEINELLKSNSNFIYSPNDYEYLIVFGGDGTFLDALKSFYDKSIKIILFPSGNLNFFGSDFVNKDWYFEDFSLLEILINGHKFYAVNEISIFNNNSTFFTNMYIDNIHLLKLQSSGFMVCTSLGSSGLNRSVGGPLFLDINLMCFNELFPALHNKNQYLNQPLIVNNKHELNFYNLNIDNKFLIKLDGKVINLKKWKNISIKLIKSCAKINLNYFKWINSIKSKLI